MKVGAGPGLATAPPAPRLVIVLAGPTGAGKSTWAARHGLDVVSWEATGRRDYEFWNAVGAVAVDRHARVVIERSAPDRLMRYALADAADADRVYVLAPVLDEVIERILTRGRVAMWHEVEAAAAWYDRYEPDVEHGPPPARLPW